jgi:hypothetical protein
MKRSPAEWVNDAAVLAEIGRHFDSQSPLTVQVRLPRKLALAAIESWDRDANVSPLPVGETEDERRIRRRSGLLGLIGNALSFVDLGEAKDIAVSLPVHLVGRALYQVWDEDRDRKP